MIAQEIIDWSLQGELYVPPRWLEPTVEACRGIVMSWDDEGRAGFVERIGKAQVVYSDKVPAGWALLVTEREE